jgi:hypothetical protein
MRPIHVVLAAMILLPGIAFASEPQDCRSACAADRESRYMNCPSPDDASGSTEEHAQCMQNCMAIYENCISQCPADPPPPAHSERQTSLAERTR